MKPYVCPKCDGERDRMTTCAVCDGTGVVWGPKQARQEITITPPPVPPRLSPTWPYRPWVSPFRWDRIDDPYIVYSDDRTSAGDPNAGRPVLVS